MILPIEEIERRIYSKENEMGYIGFNMSGFSPTENMLEKSKESQYICKVNNFNLLKDKFDDFLFDLEFKDFKLESWKGGIWWGEPIDSYGCIEDFSGWSTSSIIEWLIKNKPYPKKIIRRIIDKDSRYNILKLQNWKCNQCAVTLKYNNKSNWEGEVAHVDHIHPFSKKESYVNGAEKINEISNLQALCPTCNQLKSNKEVH